jgi:O-antigen ligase
LDYTIFLSLLVLIALSALPSAVVGHVWDEQFEYSAVMLGTAAMIDCFVSQRWRTSAISLLIPIIALIMVAFLQILPMPGGRTMSRDPVETKRFILRVAAIGLTLALLLHYTYKQSRLRALVYLVVGIGVTSAVSGMIRQALELGDAGSYGQFANRNHFALLMEMVFGLTVGMAFSGSGRLERWLFLLASLVTWTALVLANSRGGILGMLAEVALLTSLLLIFHQPFAHRWRGDCAVARDVRPLRRIGRLVLSYAAVIVLVVGATLSSVMWVGGNPVVHRLESVPREFRKQDDSPHKKARRLEIWRATWAMIKAHPVFGVGLGAYGAAIPDYLNPSGGWQPREAHNEYLELLACGGVVSGVIVACFVVALFMLSRKGFDAADSWRRAACVGALAGLFGVVVHSFVDYGLHIMLNAIICCVLLVVATVRFPSHQRDVSSATYA